MKQLEITVPISTVKLVLQQWLDVNASVTTLMKDRADDSVFSLQSILLTTPVDVRPAKHDF